MAKIIKNKAIHGYRVEAQGLLSKQTFFPGEEVMLFMYGMTYKVRIIDIWPGYIETDVGVIPIDAIGSISY